MTRDEIERQVDINVRKYMLDGGILWIAHGATRDAISWVLIDSHLEPMSIAFSAVAFEIEKQMDVLAKRVR